MPCWPGGGLARSERSVHARDQLVDELLAVAPRAAALLAEAVALLLEAALRGGELEGPQEVGGLLEAGPHGVDLVDEVLHAVDALLAEAGRDDLVVGQRDALLADLAETALVYQFPHTLERGVAVGDIRLHHLEHVEDRLVHLEEHAVVQLLQAQELQNLARLGAELDD